jgi:parallel beta-helix repeat protein
LARASVLLLGLLLVVSLGASSGRAAGGCAVWAAENGNDGARGTQASPFRTIGHLVAAVPAGRTGCLAGGAHFDEHVVFGRPGVHIRSVGAAAILTGTIRFRRSAPGSSVAKLTVRGDDPHAAAIVSVHADRVILTALDVSGPNYVNAHVACVRIGKADGVVVHGLRVHDCTKISSHKVYAPGIVVASGSGARILDNYVFHVPGDGVLLAPNATGARVSHNLFFGNSSGIYLRGSSSGNVISENVVTYSGRWNVHGDGVGSGNVVTANCLWGSALGDVGGRGFQAYGNLVTPPRYAHRGQDFALLPGPCAGKAPRPSLPLGTGAPAHATRPAHAQPKPAAHTLPRFLVRYTLNALPARVQVVSLTFTGLKPGAGVQVRCVSRCSASERLTADPSGNAFSVVLNGRWLPRGAVVDVVERKSGWRSVFARIRVTGLPRGVAIVHGSGR